MTADDSQNFILIKDPRGLIAASDIMTERVVTQCQSTRRIRIICLITLLIMKQSEVEAIDCYVGYGQEGREHTACVEWPRKCPNTNYCFKVVTNDINKAKALVDYSWVSSRAHPLEYLARLYLLITLLNGIKFLDK